jgi:hypothetical protein
MSLQYLPEHAQAALLALDLAQKEATHLRYSQSTLFALPIDMEWVKNLVLLRFHCDFSLTARQSSFSKLSGPA